MSLHVEVLGSSVEGRDEGNTSGFSSLLLSIQRCLFSTRAAFWF